MIIVECERESQLTLTSLQNIFVCNTKKTVYIAEMAAIFYFSSSRDVRKKRKERKNFFVRLKSQTMQL